MQQERWQLKRIQWYFTAKDTPGKWVLGLQWIFLCVGILKGIPSRCALQLWLCLVYISDLPCCLPYLSASGLGAAANALGITGAVFIWIVNLASQQVCTVPLKRLYEWAYPRYRHNFILSEVLLLLCVYSGAANGQGGSPVQAAYFLAGGLCGFIYILRMCMDFIFNAPQLKNIAHSYIISRINSKSERDFGRHLLWEQHLLEDCYDCLEGEYYENLETILNESFTEGYEKAEKAFNSEDPQEPSRGNEETEIGFFSEQCRMWDAAVNNKTLSASLKLMALNIERMRHEITEETFLPKFNLTREEELAPSQSSSTLPDGKVSVVPGRVCWFLFLARRPMKDDFFYMARQMYDWTIKWFMERPVQHVASWKTIDHVFHELLLVSYVYFSVDDAYAEDRVAWYPALVQIWEGISTELELSEDRFDILFSWGTLIYAAINEWTYDYYTRQEIPLRKIAYSIKNSLLHQSIIGTIRLRRESLCTL